MFRYHKPDDLCPLSITEIQQNGTKMATESITIVSPGLLYGAWVLCS